MQTYRCDVLIVGGGILGVWVLQRLIQAGYQSPVLLEAELLGCRQTGHSAAFLHQGYAYYKRSGVRVLMDAWKAWQPWLPVPIPPCTSAEAYHVYLQPNIHQRVVAWHQGPNLPVPPPQHQLQATCPALGALGVRHHAIGTDECCVPADWIVERLSDGLASHIQKICEITRFHLAYDPTMGMFRVQSVEVILGDGFDAVFEPNTLVLCAGHTNQTLLNPTRWVVPSGRVSPAFFARWNQIQHSDEVDTVVISDPTGTLTVFNGSILGGTVSDGTGQSWNIWAFVVSRIDLDGRTVWIVVGGISHAGLGTYSTGPAFRRMLIDFLANLFSFGQTQAQMTWGVYPGQLTTWRRPTGYDELSSQTFDTVGIEGLLVCYSDRLTIAPLAAEEIEREISLVLRPRWQSHSFPLPALPPQPVAVHPEYWRTHARWEHGTSMNWADFQANCL